MFRLAGAIVLPSLMAALALLAAGCGEEEGPATTPPSSSPTATEAATASPTQTVAAAEWITYENTKYGYQIRHPSTASIKAATGTPGEPENVDVAEARRLIVDLTPGAVPPDAALPFSIIVQPNPKSLSAEEHVQELKDEAERAKEAGETPFGLAERILGEGLIEIGDIPAYRTVQFGFGRDQMVTYLANDEFTYRVAYFTSSNPDDRLAGEHFVAFEAMLLTFRFTR